MASLTNQDIKETETSPSVISNGGTNDIIRSEHGAVDGKSSETTSSSVQVAVRIRPLVPSESGSTKCVDVLASKSDTENESAALTENEATNPPKKKRYNVLRVGSVDGPSFTFDQVLPGSTSQQEVYEICVSRLVCACLDGYNA